MMHKGFFRTACVLGALAVALGAFGAHGLKNLMNAQQLGTFETAVRYQFYHVFALIITALLYKEVPHRLVVAAGRCFILGMVLFCGSLFMLTVAQYFGLAGFRWLGPVTPIGGVAFITGWLLMLAALMNKRN